MATALGKAASDKRRAGSLGLQLEIFKSTSISDFEKRRLFNNLRQDAVAFFGCSQKDSEVTSSRSDVLKDSTVQKVSSRSILAASFLVRGPNSPSFQQFPSKHYPRFWT